MFATRRRGRRAIPVVAILLVAAAAWAAGAHDLVGQGVVASDGPGTPPDVTPSPDISEPADDRADVDGPVDAAALHAGPGLPVIERQLPADRLGLRDDEAALQATLEGVIASLSRSLDQADLSVAVRDASGRRIVDHGPANALMPASTMKSVTAAVALHALGPDHRLATTVAATAAPVDGVVRGDLVLVGGGDPGLTSEQYRRHVYPSRPSTTLEDLADAVVDAGITTVTGRLVADGVGWGGAPVAAGWRPIYLDDLNGRRITRLTVDAGLDVSVTIGTPVQVELRASTDPPQRAAAVFAAMLAERGVAVRGNVTTSAVPVPAGHPIAAIHSAPVSELLPFMMQRSDNHQADTLLREAAHVGVGDGSWAGAHRVAVEVLDALGVDTSGMHVADGSGLSRLDRLTAAQLVDLDVAMMAGPYADAWQASMAVTGQQGTLRNRLRGTAGDGRFLGKTGTLDDAKAVVGHVVSTSVAGPRLHVAVVSNGRPYGGNSAATVLMDRLQLALIDHLDGCSTTWSDTGVPDRSCPAA